MVPTNIQRVVLANIVHSTSPRRAVILLSMHMKLHDAAQKPIWPFILSGLASRLTGRLCAYYFVNRLTTATPFKDSTELRSQIAVYLYLTK